MNTNRATARDFKRAAPNDLLRMWPVSKRVNVLGRGDDDPSLIEPVDDEAIADRREFGGGGRHGGAAAALAMCGKMDRHEPCRRCCATVACALRREA